MANTASSSIYEKLTITKNGREVDLAGKTVGFDYFESLLSPNITATLSFVDTGFSLKDEKRQESKVQFIIHYQLREEKKLSIR